MTVPSLPRRRALMAMGAAVLWPRFAEAERVKFTLATAALPPLTSAPGHEGFLDLLARDVFGRIGIDARLVVLPGERGLINANQGIEDGDMFRTPGFESEYQNLVRVPEKLMDFDFVAVSLKPEVQVRQWSDLSKYSVAYSTGRKIFERNAAVAREVTTVRELRQLYALLASGRVDVILHDRWQGLWLARGAGLDVRVQEPALARLQMFIYLHRRHQARVAPLTAALAEARRDGSWQRHYAQALQPLESKR